MPAENSDQESMLSYQVAKMMRIYLLPEPFFPLLVTQDIWSGQQSVLLYNLYCVTDLYIYMKLPLK